MDEDADLCEMRMCTKLWGPCRGRRSRTLRYDLRKRHLSMELRTSTLCCLASRASRSLKYIYNTYTTHHHSLLLRLSSLYLNNVSIVLPIVFHPVVLPSRRNTV